MGYTHYWYLGEKAPVPADAFGKLALDAKKLFAVAAEQGFALAGPMGEGQPAIKEGFIGFNGAEPAYLEAVVFNPAKIGFNFVKTEHLPYDTVVCAFLLRAEVHFGAAIEVHSDGGWDSWESGRVLYQDTFGEPTDGPHFTDEEDDDDL